MPIYIVTVSEVWDQGVLVEAENPEEAKRLVEKEDGDRPSRLFQFSHTLDGVTVEEANEYEVYR